MIVKRRSYKDLIPVLLCILMLGVGGYFLAKSVIQPTFTISDPDISPTAVNIGEDVTISVTVTNTDKFAGSHEVVLRINGDIIAIEEVSLTGHASRLITFSKTPQAAGSHTVDVNGQSAAFTVSSGPGKVPEVSTPAGPSTGKTNQVLTFSTSADINVAGNLEYRFDWGDRSYSSWSSLPSVSHSWSSPGTYTIRAQARLVTGALTSEWSPSKTVNIVVETFRLSISVSPPGSGSVRVNIGAESYEVRTTDTRLVDAGSTVTLTATATSGYRFDHWSGDVSSTNRAITVTMNSNKNVIANFVCQYTLTTSVSPPGGGSISISPSSSDGKYDSATRVTLTANAASGYGFDRWEDEDGVSESSNPVTITMNSDKSVTAYFTSTEQVFKAHLTGYPLFYTGAVFFEGEMSRGDTMRVIVRELPPGDQSIWRKWSVAVYDPSRHEIDGAPLNLALYDLSFTAALDGFYRVKVWNSGYPFDVEVRLQPPVWNYAGNNGHGSYISK